MAINVNLKGLTSWFGTRETAPVPAPAIQRRTVVQACYRTAPKLLGAYVKVSDYGTDTYGKDTIGRVMAINGDASTGSLTIALTYTAGGRNFPTGKLIYRRFHGIRWQRFPRPVRWQAVAL